MADDLHALVRETTDQRLSRHVCGNLRWHGVFVTEPSEEPKRRSGGLEPMELDHDNWPMGRERFHHASHRLCLGAFNVELDDVRLAEAECGDKLNKSVGVDSDVMARFHNLVLRIRQKP